MYHHVADNTPPSTSVTVAEFEANLKTIRDLDYQPIAMSTFLQHIKEQIPFPDRCVLLTSDDGYKDLATHAVPLLQKYGYPMAFFINVEPVDRRYGAFLTWEQMRQLKDKGIEFYNHSYAHDHLASKKPGESDQAWLDRIMADLNKAQERIQTELGTQDKVLAYPFGEYNLQLAQRLRDEGWVAFEQASGALELDDNPQIFQRFPINRTYTKTFAMRLKTQSLPVKDWGIASPMLNPGQSISHTIITFKRPWKSPGALDCFVEGKPVKTQWQNPEKTQLLVTFNQPQSGKGKLNCTSHMGKGHYAWGSFPFYQHQSNAQY